MRLVFKLIRYGDLAAFFFFAWVIMMLWNSIVAGHLGALPSLSYLQSCGLWFLLTLLFAWAGPAGTALGWPLRAWRKTRDWDQMGRDVERRIKSAFTRWTGAPEDVSWDELGPLIERRIKSKVRKWLEEEEK
ncbi:MAG: hypothetical protein ACP5G2_06280 [Candidatus Bipolaricaulaceae bacterium]